jgi:hypothetical protein
MVSIDGLSVSIMGNSYERATTSMNDAATAEVVYETGAVSAETGAGSGGVAVNMIPKEGGNTFSGTAFGNFANRSMQGSNYSEALKAQGLRTPDQIREVWDQSASLGGPVKRDRLWFFFSQRFWGANRWVADTYFAKDPLAFVYEPDFDAAPRPSPLHGKLETVPIDNFPSQSLNLRLTGQATPKNKIALYYQRYFRSNEFRGITRTTAPEAAYNEKHRHIHAVSASYSATITNRLLVEAAALDMKSSYRHYPTSPTAGLPTTLSARELSTGVVFRARPQDMYTNSRHQSARASLTYVTGSHAFKSGFTMIRGTNMQQVAAHGDVNLILLNGVPNSVTLWASPWTRVNEQAGDIGLYAQDRWTIRRMTLNLAVRFDSNHQQVPEQYAAGGIYVGPRLFGPVDVNHWKDIGPRVGLAYDLFGTGKTALKATLSRYVMADATRMANLMNPINTSVNSTTATWNDLNRDFIPQANELGPLSNVNFGKVVPRTTFSPDVFSGWGVRPSNWEFSATVQHEVLPRVSAEVGYFRRAWGNHWRTDNLAVTPADFDPFCITAPVDARLPGGGGNQICGLYDVKPSKFGQSDDFVQAADTFGNATQVFDGIDVNVSARLGVRAFASGGIATGREKAAFCTVIDNPGQFTVPYPQRTGSTEGDDLTSRFCEITPPWQPEFKVNGAYTFPWDISVSGSFRSLPGYEITATQAVPNAQIVPSLGRNLAAGARGTYLVDLIQPGTLFGDRFNQVDLRVAKRFRVANTALDVMVDLFNVFNVSTVTAINTTYGPDWLKPSVTAQARFAKVGAQLSF